MRKRKDKSELVKYLSDHFAEASPGEPLLGKAKTIDAKSPFVNMLLNLKPGKKVLIVAERFDNAAELSAIITVMDYGNKQVFEESLFKIHSVSTYVD